MTIGHADNIRHAAPEASAKPPVKRNRTQLSCTYCRHAKLKCDRERPCSQCVKRGRSSECTFLPPVARKKSAISMQNRLKHLESLVKGAMGNQSSDEPTDPRGISQSPPFQIPSKSPHQNVEGGPSDASGRVILGLEPNDTTYVGATHWAAMLDDIEEVQAYFSDTTEEVPLGDGSLTAEPDVTVLLNNTTTPSTLDDLLNTLPERGILNQFISRFFNSSSPSLHLIHKPTFQKNYGKFCSDPHTSPVSFIALIYSIICMGTFSALIAGEEEANAGGPPTKMIRIYRRCCMECLALSNYAKHPGPYTLETFLIYIESELVLKIGDQVNCYLIVGVAVRLALRMGLHRDSANIEGDITAYRGEMRRRVWHLLVQIDLLVSFHNGLPSMVQAVRSDTRVPLNLQDQDFDEASTELPPSRPETEITGMSYTLAKGRLARVFGKIVEQVNLLTLPEYAEITALDLELQQAFAAVPSFLRVVPMDFCITDPADLIIRRFSLAVIFHKSRCILHRKYLVKEKQDIAFTYSRKAAIESSMELLRIQSDVYNAIQPGGLLCKDSWVISSLAMHDLLLAAVIIYFCVAQEIMAISSTTRDQQLPNTHQREMIEALETSGRIWFKTTSMSLDTRRAHAVVDSMLKRLKPILQPESVETRVSARTNDASGNAGSISRLSLDELFSLPEVPASTVGQDFRGQHEKLDESIPFPSTTIQPSFEFESMPVEFIEGIIGNPVDLDWDIFDNHFR